MEESNTNKCYPRIPNTHINYLCETCYIECGKPYYPAKPNHGDMALCLFPCALVADIMCCVPMIFGYYNVILPTK